MNLLKPPALKKGDTIGIVAPASYCPEPSALVNGQESLEKLGFRTVVGKHVVDRHGFLAGKDSDRLSDIEDMFRNPEIQGIICLRGGYGSSRFLPQLNYDLIRANPKVFIGYSDITALHAAIMRHCGLVTFWGPMVSSDMSPSFTPYNRDSFLRAVTKKVPIGAIDLPDPTIPLQTLNDGAASGSLIGGTLSLLASSIGTPYDLDYDGAILFFEAVGEEPHRIDRMLTQLLHADKLTRVSGIVIGECAGCGSASHNPAFPYGNFSIEEVFIERLCPLGVPILYGLTIGHGTYTATLPLGVQASIDGKLKSFCINESGVI